MFMSFNDVFKKGFLQSYDNNITFQYAVSIMLICLIISLVICVVYYFKAKKYFFSKEFAVSLVALAVITSAIILTIQSSIVISLGMVGALSIVRFRTAIKNPLDLIFLFWSISVGIICGAGLLYIAIPLTLILSIVILLSDELPNIQQNRILVLDGRYPYNKDELTEVLKKYVKYYSVRTESIHADSVNLIIEVKGVRDGSAMLAELKAGEDFHDIAFLVQEGTVD